MLQVFWSHWSPCCGEIEGRWILETSILGLCFSGNGMLAEAGSFMIAGEFASCFHFQVLAGIRSKSGAPLALFPARRAIEEWFFLVNWNFAHYTFYRSRFILFSDTDIENYGSKSRPLVMMPYETHLHVCPGVLGSQLSKWSCKAAPDSRPAKVKVSGEHAYWSPWTVPVTRFGTAFALSHILQSACAVVSGLPAVLGKL